ncbi:virulence factor TspB C-terminal domain-related protein [Acinetobacter nosocomialis]|uniref:virulence factor TspB C-terminal domain-related protein n=1 Tax=Acinetobacter nosocomialis TaxID=106654 RepID=UPI00148F08DD|nr:virulence factor TspB C-terminal domain-related protein [Acinetobacter nosocomialis]MBR7691961.1 hypothetical protein [Acinetobacter nosocomialis]
MRFLKYLILIFSFFYSANALADIFTISGLDSDYASEDAACTAYRNKFYPQYSSQVDGSGTANPMCHILVVERYYPIIKRAGALCPQIGYPMYLFFDAGSPIPQQRCKKVGENQYCVYRAKPDSIILNHENNRQSTVLYNTTKDPVPTCSDSDAGQCNKNDPYGGCFQPPNDGCTRLSDGSITCPDNMPPPDIKNTCGGQTYCNRPPTGCGSGYVSGSYNGQSVCVKSSSSSGSGSGSGTGTGTGDGSGSGTGTGSGNGSSTGMDTGTGTTNINNTSNSTSNSNTTINNSGGSGGTGSSTTQTDSKIDFTPVVQAISALSDKLTWVKSELVNAVSRVEDKLTQTNTKLDSVKSSVDQTTNAVNANGDKVKSAVDANTAATNSVKSAVDANTNATTSKLNDVVNAINNKPVGGGGGGSTDMKPTNDLLTSIKEFLTGKVDTSSLKADVPSQEFSAQTLDTGSFKSNPQCPADVSLALPGLGSYTFSYSRFCDALQLAGYFIMIAAYLYAALIVSKA